MLCMPRILNHARDPYSYVHRYHKAKLPYRNSLSVIGPGQISLQLWSLFTHSPFCIPSAHPTHLTAFLFTHFITLAFHKIMSLAFSAIQTLSVIALFSLFLSTQITTVLPLGNLLRKNCWSRCQKWDDDSAMHFYSKHLEFSLLPFILLSNNPINFRLGPILSHISPSILSLYTKTGINYLHSLTQPSPPIYSPFIYILHLPYKCSLNRLCLHKLRNSLNIF